jgi:hypothetical protein
MGNKMNKKILLNTLAVVCIAFSTTSWGVGIHNTNNLGSSITTSRVLTGDLIEITATKINTSVGEFIKTFRLTVVDRRSHTEATNAKIQLEFSYNHLVKATIF